MKLRKMETTDGGSSKDVCEMFSSHYLRPPDDNKDSQSNHFDAIELCKSMITREGSSNRLKAECKDKNATTHMALDQ